MNQQKEIEITKIHPFENHPYQVRDDDEMNALIESIRQYGVLSPIIVRPKENTIDEYEIISGHRRFRAVMKLGLTTTPAFIYPIDRDTATVMVVDSNLHRDKLLPSEKAFAYKMKLEALKHQGKAWDEASRQVVGRQETADLVSEGESGRQVQRYIRLTELIPPLLRYVDEGRIALTPAVALSYLLPYEQEWLADAIEYYDCTPSLSQSLLLKANSISHILTEEQTYDILSEDKPNQKDHVRFRCDDLKRFFPEGCSSGDMSRMILRLLEKWSEQREAARKRNQSKEECR